MIGTRALLIRHAETAESSRGRCYGKLDVELSDKGRLQAARLAEWLKRSPIDAVYASPRRRSIETAEALGHRVMIEEDLREIDFGLFEGRTYDDIQSEYPDIYRRWMEAPTELQFPGGESYQDMKRRVLACHRKLVERHVTHTFAMVTHGGTCRVILGDALQLADRNVFRLGADYASVSSVHYLGNFPLVERVNATLGI